jgi:hypothetical protein
VVGSDRAELTDAEAKTARRAGVLGTPLAVTASGDRIHIAVGAAPAGAPRAAGVYLIGIARSRTVAISRGENAGAQVTYFNVVRSITKLGDWSGSPLDLEARPDQAHADGADTYAVIVQAGGRAAPSAILAAARAPEDEAASH